MNDNFVLYLLKKIFLLMYMHWNEVIQLSILGNRKKACTITAKKDVIVQNVVYVTLPTKCIIQLNTYSKLWIIEDIRSIIMILRVYFGTTRQIILVKFCWKIKVKIINTTLSGQLVFGLKLFISICFIQLLQSFN